MAIPTRKGLENLARGFIKDRKRFDELLDMGELDDNAFRSARRYFLAAVDREVLDKKISDTKAKSYYDALGFSKEEMVKLRQEAGTWKLSGSYTTDF